MGRLSTNNRYIAADFETTVYDGQTDTAVWSACYSELFTDNVKVCHSVDEFLDDLFRVRQRSIIWFHNLRFDGSFIVDYILRNGWTHTTKENKYMTSKEFRATISQQNRWYCLTLCYRGTFYEFRDSAKLMPMTLADMGKAFDTTHRKLEMEYKGRRYPGCLISDEEMKYIINDVLVLKEALEIMLRDGHTKLTIGACCMSEFKGFYTREAFSAMFPDLKAITLEERYGYPNADAYIRKSYHGGWCYLKPEYSNQWIRRPGKVYDVNSLYPSVMHSVSGNYYPIGTPHFFSGAIPSICKQEGIVYFIRLKCRFYLKSGKLPTIQIRGNFMYSPNQWLATSDYRWKGKYYRSAKTKSGEIIEAIPTMVLAMTDYELLKSQYDLEDLEIIDGVWFYGEKGIFDEYIDKYMGIKMKSEGGRRTEAKLFLNNLYGKLASSDDSSYLIPYIDEATDAIQFEGIEEHEKQTISIACGSMVTAYARHFTITHAQANYENFVYSDTDSIHMLDGDAVGIEEHPSKLLCWKRESDWSCAKFIRQKTYCEFIRKHDGKKIYPYWDIKCAGMPESCKRRFLETHPITDFNFGLTVSGKLVPIRIKGGTLLVEKIYTLRKN